VRIKREQFFQRSGRPAILAGVHVGDGFLEKRTFLAIADNTPIMHSGMRLFVSFLRGFLVGPHVTTLADHRNIRGGSPSLFTPDFVSVRFLTTLRGKANWTEECNPSAIMVFIVNLNVVDFSGVRRLPSLLFLGLFSKMNRPDKNRVDSAFS
jgi:hypothetical protein